VNSLTRLAPSAVRALPPGPLIMNTKPDLRSGSNINIEYMPPSVPVCETVSTPSMSARRNP